MVSIFRFIFAPKVSGACFALPKKKNTFRVSLRSGFLRHFSITHSKIAPCTDRRQFAPLNGKHLFADQPHLVADKYQFKE